MFPLVRPCENVSCEKLAPTLPQTQPPTPPVHPPDPPTNLHIVPHTHVSITSVDITLT